MTCVVSSTCDDGIMGGVERNVESQENAGGEVEEFDLMENGGKVRGLDDHRNRDGTEHENCGETVPVPSF